MSIEDYKNSLPADDLINKCKKMMTQYWTDNPDLFQAVQKKKRRAESLITSQAVNDFSHPPKVLSLEKAGPSITPRTINALNRLNQLKQSPMLQWQPLHELKSKIQKSYQQIHETVVKNHGQIQPRTAAHNRKCTFDTIEEESQFRADLLSDQIKTWKALLPNVLRKFSRIPDPRKPGTITHKKTVLMMYGLLAFVFKLSSRREMNRELTGALIFEHFKRLFPEIDSIPHACTLARFLEKTNPQDLEEANISLIRDLIRNKKFKALLIQGCVPITIDGAQKLYRDGVLQDPRWCERSVGREGNQYKQQYVYVLEANLTLKNGLNIPLMSEFLYRNNNQLSDPCGKQDSETTAFERLAARLRKYFPRLKIIIFGDAMFATTPVMELLRNNSCEFVIRLPKRKLTDLAKILNASKKHGVEIYGQPMYRQRHQTFYWENNINTGFAEDLKLHVVGCSEHYQEVNKTTGEIEDRYSEFAWLSSLLITSDKLHELLNLGARKKWLIEDSINTMKNRGYKYKHAFSYDFNAMQGFHYLMRLGYAINSISEFSKVMKKYVKSLGCSATLKLIKKTLFSPWLPLSWYDNQSKQSPCLCLQLE